MDLVIFVVAAVSVVAVALGVVGRAVGLASARVAPAVLELEDEVDWIVGRVPDEVAARLSIGDVRRVLRWQLDELDRIGLVSDDGAVVEPSVAAEVEAVAVLDEITDAIVARAMAVDDPVDALDVVVVLDLHAQYLDEIGAIGPAVDG